MIEWFQVKDLKVQFQIFSSIEIKFKILLVFIRFRLEFVKTLTGKIITLEKQGEGKRSEEVAIVRGLNFPSFKECDLSRTVKCIFIHP